MSTERPDTFDYQKTDEEQTKRIEAIRTAYKQCMETIQENSTSSRYQSLAITNLEQSCMWAVKGIVFEREAGSYLDTPGT